MKKNNRKAKTAIIMACAMFGAFASTTATLAYLKDSTTVLANSFEVGSIVTNIEEECDIYGEKNPSIKNTGENACLVRIRCMISPEDMADNVILDTHTENTGSWYDGITSSANEVSVYDEDGSDNNYMMGSELTEEYYYYWDVVYPESKVGKLHQTTSFFDGYLIVEEDEDGNKVSIFEEDINEYSFGMLKTGYEFTPFEITVYQESVQAILTDKNGNKISAVNEDGTFNRTNAKIIWDMYDSQIEE